MYFKWVKPSSWRTSRDLWWRFCQSVGFEQGHPSHLTRLICIKRLMLSFHQHNKLPIKSSSEFSFYQMVSAGRWKPNKASRHIGKQARKGFYLNVGSSPTVSRWKKQHALFWGFEWKQFRVKSSVNQTFFICWMPGFPAVTHVPVVTVDVIQPASLLDDLHGARDVLPRGEAVPPLLFLTIAGLDAAAVGAVLLPAGIVEDALLSLWTSQDGTWRGRGGHA